VAQLLQEGAMRANLEVIFSLKLFSESEGAQEYDYAEEGDDTEAPSWAQVASEVSAKDSENDREDALDLPREGLQFLATLLGVSAGLNDHERVGYDIHKAACCRSQNAHPHY